MTDVKASLEQRIEELERRIAAIESASPESHLPDECKARECTYYTHYQVYHDAEKNGAMMGHEAFHAAEKKCEEVQNRVTQWYDAHPDGQCPKQLHEYAEYWEKKICA